MSRNVELVKDFLRAQNLEQVGRIDEAIDLYEAAVAERFDSIGPYDRLIALYSNQARHHEVIRVADAAIGNCHTYDEKRAWYESIKGEAAKALAKVPKAAPRKDS